MQIFTYIFLLLIILIGFTFAGLNSDPVAINYYVGIAKLPLALLLVIMLVSGAILGLLISLFLTIKLKTSNRRLRQRLAVVEQEVTNLRAIPLKDDH